MKRINTHFIPNVTGAVVGIVFATSLIMVAWVHAASLPSNATASTPSITKTWPEAGGKGQYITLEGQGFGSNPGRVVFVRRGVEIASDTDMPSGCDGQTWHDGYVVIKVPDRVDPGQYTIKLYRGDNITAQEVNFTVTSAPPTPGICAVTPDNGPAGVPIKVYGENFGSARGRVVLGAGDVVIQPDGWADGYIEGTTPVLSTTSDRVRVVDTNENLSNPIPFTIGRCSQNSCGTAGSCCGDGSCRAIGMCKDQQNSCSYRWSFYTGELKQLNEQCTSNEQCISHVCGTDKRCARGSLAENAACTWDQECTQGLWCDAGTCKNQLRTLGQACSNNDECQSGTCTKGMCAQGVRPIGAACMTNQQCSSNNCYNARCAPAPKKLEIVSTIPNDKNALRNGVIKVTFNQLINEDSAKSRIRIEPFTDGHFEFTTIGDGDTAQTEVRFIPDGLLNPNTDYQIEIGGGIESAYGDQTFDGANEDFKTGTKVGELDHVVIYASNAADASQPTTSDFFDCAKSTCGGEDANATLAGNQHVYHAYGLDSDGMELSNIRKYLWSVDSTATLQLPSVLNQPSVEVTAKAVNGTATITSTLTQCETSACNSDGQEVETSISVENYLCDNLWDFDSNSSGFSSFPYNFRFYYCRGNDSTSLQPSLLNMPIQVDPTKDRGIFDKEYIFQFADPQNAGVLDTQNSDVISMRVAHETEPISARQWYISHRPGQTPTDILIDGYKGVRDADGFYVAVPGTDKQMYILYFSDNDGAKQVTEDIFSTLMKNLKLSVNVAGEQDPGILRRDVVRIGDIADIELLLSQYTSSGKTKYPALVAGSFIKGQSTSAWPSWQSSLGNELHAALPADPLAATAGSFPACPKTGGYDSKTCWNSQASKFGLGSSVEDSLKNSSTHVYTYTTTNGSGYRLCANLENGSRFELPNLYCQSK